MVLIGLPFFDRPTNRNLLPRRGAIAALVLLLGGAGFLIGAAGRAPATTLDESAGLNATQRAGRALYQSQQCAGCHKIAGQGGEEGPDLTTVGLRHSGGWMHSFIESPGRFHQESRMPAYGPPALSHQEIEELAQYLATLRGRAAAPPAQFYDTFPPPRRP
jgi:mono/diheme cytochrome c family protein